MATETLNDPAPVSRKSRVVAPAVAWNCAAIYICDRETDSSQQHLSPTAAVNFSSSVSMLVAALLPAGSAAQVVDVPDTPATVFYALAARGDTLFAGGAGTLYHSFDRGQSWEAAATIATGATSVDAIIATDAGWFASCYSLGVFRSSDLGATWTAVNQGLTGIGALWVSDFEQHGTKLYAASDAGVFVLDLTSPTSWAQFGNEFAENEAQTVAELAVGNGNLVAVAGGNGLLFIRPLTADAWTPVQLSGHLLSVSNTGGDLVATSGHSVFFSSDDGANWQPTAALPTTGFSGTVAEDADGVPDTAAYLAVTTNAGLSLLYRSSDLDDAWNALGTTTETLHLLEYGDRLYLAQVDGLRYLPINPGTGTEDPGEPESSIVFLESFPNPTADQAEIRFRSSRAGQIRLEIFDLAGRIVRLHLRDVLPGQTGVDWDASGLPGGVYFARLSDDWNSVTKSLVVAR